MLEMADSHGRPRVKSLQPVQRTVFDRAYIRDLRAETEDLTVGDHSLRPALIYVFVLVHVFDAWSMKLGVNPFSSIFFEIIPNVCQYV